MESGVSESLTVTKYPNLKKIFFFLGGGGVEGGEEGKCRTNVSNGISTFPCQIILISKQHKYRSYGPDKFNL